MAFSDILGRDPNRKTSNGQPYWLPLPEGVKPAHLTSEYRRPIVHYVNYWGPYRVPYKITNVLCPDGRYRTARTAIEPVTLWSIPARVSVKGKTVSGWAVSTTTEDGRELYLFAPHPNGRNAHVFAAYQIPKAASHCRQCGGAFDPEKSESFVFCSKECWDSYWERRA